MIKSLIKVALLAAVLLIPSVTWSQPGPGFPGMPPFMGQGGGPQKFRGERPGQGMHMGRWWNHPEVQEKLGLTPEQVEKLNAQRLETETKMIEVRARMQIAQLRLRELVNKKDASEEEIGKLIDEIGNLQKENMKTVIGQSRSTQQVLNEDQIAKVKKFMENRKAKAMKAREGFPPGKGKIKEKDKGPAGMKGDKPPKGPGPDMERPGDCPLGKGPEMDRERERERNRDRDGDRDRGRDGRGEGRRRGGPDGDRPGPGGPGGPRGKGFGMAPEGFPGMPGEPGMMEGPPPLPMAPPEAMGEMAPPPQGPEGPEGIGEMPPAPEAAPELGEGMDPNQPLEPLFDFDAGIDEMLADFE